MSQPASVCFSFLSLSLPLFGSFCQFSACLLQTFCHSLSAYRILLSTPLLSPSVSYLLSSFSHLLSFSVCLTAWLSSIFNAHPLSCSSLPFLHISKTSCSFASAGKREILCQLSASSSAQHSAWPMSAWPLWKSPLIHWGEPLSQARIYRDLWNPGDPEHVWDANHL